MPRARTWTILAAAIALLAYAASGFYFVESNERGVVRWFGRVYESGRKVQPGLHYAAPWPICQVDTPKTTEVRRVYVSLLPAQREAIARGEIESIEASPASDVLSGDVNILKVTMVVQYQVIEPAAYLFNTKDPDQLVRDAVQAILIEELAGIPVDEALTSAKARLQLITQRRAQETLDRYGCGVQLVAANLESIQPPRAIIAAFQDVVSAKKDGEKSVDSAVAEASRVVSRARGEAARIHEEALAYASTRLSRARGETARFLSILAEYRRQPEVYERRLMLQTFESILPDMRIYILDHQEGDPPTRVRIVDSPE